MKILLVSALTLTTLQVGCKTRPQPPKEWQGIAVAQVGERLILDSELLEHISHIEKETPQRLTTHNQKKALLDQLINIELLYQEAERRRFQDSFVFKARLAESFVEELANEARAEITPSVIERHYLENRRQYDQISARHLLLKTENLRSEEEKRKAFEKAQNLHSQALRNPDRFEQLAREHSQDGSAPQGGELGFFSFHQMVPEFSRAAFGLKQIQEVSGIVQTQFGYHIIQLSGDRRGIEFHKEAIERDLFEKSRQNFLRTEVARLRNQQNIEIYEDHLLSLSPLPEVIQMDPDEVLPKELNLDD